MIEITWEIAQKKKELYGAFELLDGHQIKTVLEIGTLTGGTAMFWAKMVQPRNGHVYTVDIQDFPTCFSGTPESGLITRIKGDSHLPSTVALIKGWVGMVDLLFIDGDHTYDGVKTDFNNFFDIVNINGFIGFHDIKNMTAHNPSYGVHRLWEELKEKYQHWEFIDNDDPSFPVDFMGIGLIQKETK